MWCICVCYRALLNAFSERDGDGLRPMPMCACSCDENVYNSEIRLYFDARDAMHPIYIFFATPHTTQRPMLDGWRSMPHCPTAATYYIAIAELQTETGSRQARQGLHTSLLLLSVENC
jgi:hypothetical protein